MNILLKTEKTLPVIIPSAVALGTQATLSHVPYFSFLAPIPYFSAEVVIFYKIQDTLRQWVINQPYVQNLSNKLHPLLHKVSIVCEFLFAVGAATALNASVPSLMTREILCLSFIALGSLFAERIGRKVLSLQKGSPKKDLPEKDSLPDAIEKFKKAIEEKLASSEINAVKRIYRESEGKNKEMSQMLEELNKLLSSKKSYLDSLSAVIEIGYFSLNIFLNPSSDKAQIEAATAVYKKISAFLRKETSDEYKKNYHEYVNRTSKSGAGKFVPMVTTYGGGVIPGSYFSNDKRNSILHNTMIHVLRQLRKQIKLNSKKDKIEKNVKSQMDLLLAKNKRSREAFERAKSYLGITWAHGTKAFVIKSACENCEKKILHFGELKSRKVPLLTGKIASGAAALGVNSYGLSGVSLSCAKESKSYAKEFTFSEESLMKLYNSILTDPYTSIHHYQENEGRFSSKIEALRRIQTHRPEIFEKDKEALNKKLEEIYQGMETCTPGINQTKLLDANGSDCYRVYNFLKALEDFEALLNHPLSTQSTSSEEDIELTKIPLVLASKTKYGMPLVQSTFFEAHEEVRIGGMTLGEDIQCVFTIDEHIHKVQELLKHYGLAESVQVESMDVLEAASRLDQAMGSYFYDVYSVKKWSQMAAAT